MPNGHHTGCDCETCRPELYVPPPTEDQRLRAKLGSLTADAKRKLRHASHLHHTAGKDRKADAEETLYQAARALVAAELLEQVGGKP